MGVQIKMSNPLDIFTAAGVPKSVTDKVVTLLATGDVDLVVEFYHVHLHRKSDHKKVSVKLPCITTALLKNSAMPMQVDISRKALTELVDMAWTHFGAGIPQEEKQKETYTAQELLDKVVKKPKKVSASSAEKVMSAIDQFLAEEKKKSDPVTMNTVEEGTPVPLAKATKILQPVRGTDPTSVYQVIALSPKVKVAGRVKGGTNLSLRVEGELPAVVVKQLKALGMKESEGHMSIHLAVPDQSTVGKVVGGVLYAAGVEFEETIPVGKVSQIKGS